MKRWPDPRVPLWNVVERHFDEADFLAEHWRRAADEPDWTLTELAVDLEARLSLHLEGLAVAGPAALHEIAWPNLEEAAFVSTSLTASLAILEQGDLDDLERLLAQLDQHPPEHERWRGITAALGLSTRAGLTQWLIARLEQAEGRRLAGIAEALAHRRVELGPLLTRLLCHDEPAVLRAAAALAVSGDAAQLGLLAGSSAHADPGVVAAVMQTCLLREVSGALEVARAWAFDAAVCEFRREAMVWMSVFGSAADQRRVIELVAEPSSRRAALWAAGFAGRVEAVEAAIAWLEDEEVGPLAAEVVSAIAGLPRADETLWIDQPREDDERSGLPALEHDDLDAELAPDAEATLPTPHAERVRAWWHARRDAFDRGRSWLAGRELDDAGLLHALVHEPLRRRHVLALVLHHRSRHRPAGPLRLATRDWACSQLRQLEVWRA